jgi:lipopolysaccharide/colanic/teichoic acid biosynthesis glycosyltransferase
MNKQRKRKRKQIVETNRPRTTARPGMTGFPQVWADDIANAATASVISRRICAAIAFPSIILLTGELSALSSSLSARVAAA